MARKLRVEYPAAIHHVMNPDADRREPIFLDEADRQRFVQTLGEVGAKTGWLHAWLDFKLQIADRRFTPAARAPAGSIGGTSCSGISSPDATSRSSSMVRVAAISRAWRWSGCGPDSRRRENRPCRRNARRRVGAVGAGFEMRASFRNPLRQMMAAPRPSCHTSSADPSESGLNWRVWRAAFWRTASSHSSRPSLTGRLGSAHRSQRGLGQRTIKRRSGTPSRFSCSHSSYRLAKHSKL